MLHDNPPLYGARSHQVLLPPNWPLLQCPSKGVSQVADHPYGGVCGEPLQGLGLLMMMRRLQLLAYYQSLHENRESERKASHSLEQQWGANRMQATCLERRGQVRALKSP
jgi:hypothetical protein